MPSIAIVEAGPGTGLAIARTFGSRGFDVGLIARNRDRLNDLVSGSTPKASPPPCSLRTYSTMTLSPRR